MTQVKRFYYAYSDKRQRRVHMVSASNFSEGNPTYCSKYTQKGWKYTFEKPTHLKICSQCIDSA